MRKLLTSILFSALAMTLFIAPSFAETDTSALEALPDMAVYLDDSGIDTIIRPMTQPFDGTADEDGYSVCAFLDYIEMADEDTVFLRLTLSVEAEEELAADTLTLYVGKQDWVFRVRPMTTEYDMVYQEDYSVCMTDESLPMIKAIAKSKTDRYSFVLKGEQSLTGEITLPSAAVASLYDSYVKAGGDKQNLAFYRDVWPVKAEK